MLLDVKGFGLASYLTTHRILIDDEAAQPMVGNRIRLIKRVHGYRKAFQSFLVSVVDCSLLCNVLVKVRNLAADDTCDHIAHPVVVADLFMLVPGGVLPGLRRPLADLVGDLDIGCKQHAATGACDDLVAIERNRVERPGIRPHPR